jgi:16S rRNA (guanine966-N2)-methyltransferase
LFYTGGFELRIIAGKLRSRKFAAPPGEQTRPTADRAKVALFNMLHAGLDGARVLDGFAGSGALAFEAISRGAAMAVLFEKDGAAVSVLRENAARLGIEDYVDIRQADFLEGAPKLNGKYAFDVIFLDPPYSLGMLTRALPVAENLLAPGGAIVAEHAAAEELPEEPGALCKVRARRYGSAVFTFYKKREEP